MRDVRGRYTNPKLISDSCPPFARGCPACKCGIVAAPELTRAAPLYLERLVQAIDGDITFCACKAGQVYRVSLLNRFQALKEEARRDKRIASFAQRGTHPDIESARRAMHDSYGSVKAPSIHFDGVAVPPPADELEAEAA